MLIACPCAAGLATATAISAAIGNGARRGTLIKGGTHLEGVGRVTAVVFDKTGTLTFGRPLVTSVVTLSVRYTANEVLSLAASGELHARPLAQASAPTPKNSASTRPSIKPARSSWAWVCAPNSTARGCSWAAPPCCANTASS
ncbi:hypothetical protein [Streptomyces decoyicus]